jgi:pantothenate kinase type III
MDIAINIGNTRTAVARMTPDRVSSVTARATQDLEEFLASAAELGAGGRVFYASVVPAASGAVRRAFGTRARELTWRDVPLRVRLSKPGRVGIDRMLNCAAAFARSGSACLVVDAGSALTLDLVTARGEFAGGVIFAGRALLEASLRGLAQLKEFRTAERPALIGRDTSEAVSSGIEYGPAFLVAGYYRRLRRAHQGLRLVFTGGDGKRLQARVKTGIYRPYLTMEGIRIAAYGSS